MNTWVNDSLEDITLSVSDGDHQAPPRADSGIPFLVISNLSSGEINFHAVKRWVPKEYYDSLKSIRVPRKNDILYTVTGSFGIPVMVRQDREFCFQRHIAIIKPDNEKVDTNFLYRYLGSTGAFEQAKAVATGTAQQTVPLGGLRKFIITCPTIEEQKQIVLQVESLFNLADKVEEHYQTAKQRIDKLTQSILAKAFRGELVPQDPNDEPASELLKRIKTQQLEEAKLIRPNKKTNNKQSRIETRKSKMIIPILEALKEANKPLTGQELFASAGYSNDAETMQVEKYFLDLRDQLENKSISRQRDENKNQDIFTLVSNA